MSTRPRRAIRPASTRRGLREAAVALLAAAAVLALGALADGATLLRGLETASLDLRFRLRGPRPPAPEIALVMVDDRSLAALGRWPFSRRAFGRAVAALDGAGARTVAFDLLFAEPEQPVPDDLRAAARAAAAGLDPARDAELLAALRRLAEDDPDGALAATLAAAGRVLLPIAFSFEGAPRPAPDSVADAGYQQFDRSPVEPVFPLRPVAATPPVERLAAAAAGLGHVNLAFDRDGAPRYDYAALPFEADFIPSLPLRAVAAFTGVPWSEVALALGQGVRIGPIAVPTDRAMRMLINYRGPRGTIETLSFVDLLEGRIPAGRLRDRLVFVGAAFLGSGDAFESPFGSTPLPGTERLASIASTILQRDFVTEPGAGGLLAAMGAVLLLAAAAGYAAARLPTRAAIAAGALPVLGWGGGAQLAFAQGLWLPVVLPAAALTAAALAVLLFRYAVVDREGRQVRTAFRQYMSPEMVAVLAEHPERLQLGGERRPMTILFCDVRGFTAISEGFRDDPQRLTQLINRFLTPMTDAILARRGTIDKYMGDCVMAFWNAPLDDPDHADHACAAARDMLAALDRLNEALAAEAAREGRGFAPLRIGIGLNSGTCVVGNMGSERRFDYSVLGDAVNLASRLEGQSRNYGVDIVIGETTRAAAPGWAALELDRVAVKGKAEPATIFALLGDAAHAAGPDFQALAACHAAMLDAYRARDWAGARAALADCRSRAPALRALHDLYEDRITRYEAAPPPPGWDGVHVATEK